MKALEKIVGFLFCVPVMLVSFVPGFWLWLSVSPWLGVPVGLLTIAGGIWISRQIIRIVEDQGIVYFMSINSRSPRLDNLKPAPDSQFVEWTVEELAQAIDTEDIPYLSGELQLFGKPIPCRGETESLIGASIKGHIVTFTFASGLKVQVETPVTIFQSTTFLKILKASSVRAANGDKQLAEFSSDPTGIQIRESGGQFRRYTPTALMAPAFQLLS